MEPGVLIIIAVVALIIVGVIYSSHLARKRREAIAQWAVGRGLRFSEAKRYGFDQQYPAFKCLCEGDGRYAHNISEGHANGRAVCAFDYHYQTHSTDSKGRRQTTHHHFSAIIVASEVPLRPLVIRPETFFDKVGAFFGFDDIDFESADFSRKFCVKSPDRRWAYDVLHARAMEMLLARPAFTIQFDTRCIIVHRGNQFDAPTFEEALVVAENLLAGLPQYVREQQESPS